MRTCWNSSLLRCYGLNRLLVEMLLCVDICTCFLISVWPVPLILLLAVLNIF